VAEDEPLATEHVDGVPDLLDRRHAGRQDDRPLRLSDAPQQAVVGQAGRRDLVCRRVEQLELVDARLVPRRGEPGDAEPAALLVDRGVLVTAELDPAPVGDVGHPAPRRVPLDVPLVARHAQLGVRFWNFTRRSRRSPRPARGAGRRPSSPLWLMPISPTT
jgi:hypothetical protein